MRVFVLGLSIAVLAATSGCTGMVRTQEERENVYKEVADTDARQFVDDFDAFWLADRQYRLTEWYLR
jgi:hypothetical protein